MGDNVFFDINFITQTLFPDTGDLEKAVDIIEEHVQQLIETGRNVSGNSTIFKNRGVSKALQPLCCTIIHHLLSDRCPTTVKLTKNLT